MNIKKDEIKNKKPFDVQEAVVLLDVYLYGKSNHLKGTDVARIASERLRTLATHRGMSITDSFRSPTGLQNRLRSIGSLFEGKESVSAPGTEVFREAVALYRNDKQRYQQMLGDACDFVTQDEKWKRSAYKENEAIKMFENDFLEWLISAMPSFTPAEVKRSSKIICAMLMQKKVLPQTLFDTTRTEQVENALHQVRRTFSNKKMRNSASRLLAAYLAFLKEKENSKSAQDDPHKLIAQENWIRFDFSNAHAFERTIPIYCNINGNVLTGKSWARILVAIVEYELAEKNPALEELYTMPLRTQKGHKPFFLKEKIEGLNYSKLSNGYWINVNKSIPELMGIIQAFLLHCGYDSKQVILYGAPKEGITAKRNVAPTRERPKFDIDIVRLEAFLKSAGLHGATLQELVDAVLPGTTLGMVKNALDDSLNVIAMPEGRYVHVDSIVDLDEAEECIGKILRTHFSQFGGYSNNQLLFRAATQELSMFLNDNDCENIDAVYSIARFLFEKKAAAGEPYKFSSPHVFEQEPDYPMTLRGLMINLARNGGGVLNALDAKNYLQKTMLVYGSLGQLLQIGSSYTFLLYDSERYILSEAIGIDDYWCRNMHDRLDDLFRKANVAYVIPRDISATWLETLPPLPLGLSWTHLLLQEVLDKYPAIGFKSISPDLNQTHDTLSAAFVPIDSPLQSFPDVVTLFMEERHQLPMRMPGEELRQELREAGMLEAGEMIYALPKALDDYRFAWTDENKTVLIRGNK